MMKLLLVMSAILLSGCCLLSDSGSIKVSETTTESGIKRVVVFNQGDNSAEPSTLQWIAGGNTTMATFGQQYNVVGIKAKFNAMRPFIFAGILMVIAGAFCWAKHWLSTKVGLSMIGAGAGLSVFGTLMPQFGAYVFWALILSIVLATGYILWRHGKDLVPKKKSPQQRKMKKSAKG